MGAARLAAPTRNAGPGRTSFPRRRDRFARHLRPTVLVPFQRTDRQARLAIAVAIVEVVAEQRAAAVLQDAGVAGADEPTLGFQDKGAAALEQVGPVFVQVRPGDGA